MRTRKRSITICRSIEKLNTWNAKTSTTTTIIIIIVLAAMRFSRRVRMQTWYVCMCVRACGERVIRVINRFNGFSKLIHNYRRGKPTPPPLPPTPWHYTTSARRQRETWLGRRRESVIISREGRSGCRGARVKRTEGGRQRGRGGVAKVLPRKRRRRRWKSTGKAYD